MAGFRVRRRRSARDLEVHDAELAKRAGSALFAADERIRAAAEEFAFAEAELGGDATSRLSGVLEEARGRLSEAFRLNRWEPVAADEMRVRHSRVIELCESIGQLLDDSTLMLADSVARVRRTPVVFTEVLVETGRLRARIPAARGIVDRLAARYARSALTPVAAHPAEAEQLLAFAEHSVGVAARRRAAGQLEQASHALEASAASLRRAAALLDAVDEFEIDLLRAEADLVSAVEGARRALAGAAPEPHSRRLGDAIAELRAALADLPVIGVNTDPLAHLARVRQAHQALDAAAAPARERAPRVTPAEHRPHRVHHAIEDADRRLDAARDAVAGHPGWIGAAALTRLAESERIRLDLAHCLGSPTETVAVIDADHGARVLAMAGRVAYLASEAVQLARRDVDAFRAQGRLSAAS
ncbi:MULTISPECIES: hypothetical protein [unclassified Agromyces]|uniref:hypothetical protein n=1 Tax=unclassified Agromyces TaxID=2639701 RepID=UPI0030147DBC